MSHWTDRFWKKYVHCPLCEVNVKDEQEEGNY